MQSLSPCPACGWRFDQLTAIRWNRLFSPDDLRPTSPTNMPICDFGSRVFYWCPACKAVQSYPLDAPLAAA